jgi:hypothetical protein
MQKKIAHIFCLLLVINLAGTVSAEINYQNGILLLNCGSNKIKLDYQVSFDNQKFDNNFALLIDGSPVRLYFSDNPRNYEKISQELWDLGYKLFEIKYNYNNGFYDACLNQGIDNITRHAADIYDHALRLTNYQPENSSHRMVGFGFSIGAVLLQRMAFTMGKKFDAVGLTGVLLGDAERGCKEGLRVQSYLAQSGMSYETREFCGEPELEEGMSWASFMDLAQIITQSGQGCCIPNTQGFGACAPGVTSEYTKELNFERQPYFAASKLAIFEGSQTCVAPAFFEKFSAANPGQVNYIAQQRKLVNAPIETYFYPACAHSIINCSGQQGLQDIINFLTKI